MQVIEKHGGGAHFMRPDRVYRTGVISPWFNFAPGQDVQAVSAAFTQRSMNLSGLSGLAFAGAFGAAGRTGFLERMRLRFEAWNAKRMAAAATRKAARSAQTAQQSVQQAQQSAQAAQHAQASAQGQAHGQAFGDDKTQPFPGHGHAFQPHPNMHGMAYAQVGMQVAPHMIGQVSMLARLTSGTMPRHVAQAQVATTMERWHNLRWNG